MENVQSEAERKMHETSAKKPERTARRRGKVAARRKTKMRRACVRGVQWHTGRKKDTKMLGEN
jgi:hypothetical protein